MMELLKRPKAQADFIADVRKEASEHQWTPVNTSEHHEKKGQVKMFFFLTGDGLWELYNSF